VAVGDCALAGVEMPAAPRPPAARAAPLQPSICRRETGRSATDSIALDSISLPFESPERWMRRALRHRCASELEERCRPHRQWLPPVRFQGAARLFGWGSVHVLIHMHGGYSFGPFPHCRPERSEGSLVPTPQRASVPETSGFPPQSGSLPTRDSSLRLRMTEGMERRSARGYAPGKAARFRRSGWPGPRGAAPLRRPGR
jgi:hypothetical protein